MKGENETWDKSFVAYEFNKRQLEIMKYFNAQYECLDAHDNYSTKRNKEGQDEIKYQWANLNVLDALDDMHYAEAYSGADFDGDKQYEHCDEEDFNVLGKRAKS